MPSLVTRRILMKTNDSTNTRAFKYAIVCLRHYGTLWRKIYKIDTSLTRRCTLKKERKKKVLL